jgi:Collagen triple helix repeat (20 copies)
MKIKLALAAVLGTVAVSHHYVITSTSQIKPSVLAQLHAPTSFDSAGAPGPTGQQGPPGATGATGAAGQPGNDGVSVAGPIGATGPNGPRGESGPTGATGERGATGAIGPQGERGPEGKAELHAIIRSTTYTLTSSQAGALPARCEEGEVATGGGYEMLKGSATGVVGSFPATVEASGPPVNWYVQWDSEPGESEIRVYVVCM